MNAICSFFGHRLFGCVCGRCGKTRHQWSDGHCARCGTCETCRGAGSMPCSHCANSGQRKEYLSDAMHRSTATEFDWLSCPECNGTGKVPCPSCAGIRMEVET